MQVALLVGVLVAACTNTREQPPPLPAPAPVPARPTPPGPTQIEPPTSTAPVEVPGLDDVAQIAVADETLCARRTNGRVACWGMRLGAEWKPNGDRDRDARPREVAGITDAVDLAVSVRNACVRRANGKVACWGATDEPKASIQSQPTEVPAYANATWIGDVDGGVCAVRQGTLMCRLADSSYRPFSKGVTRVWDGAHYRSSWRCVRAKGALECQFNYSGRDEQRTEPTTLDLDLGDVIDLRLPVHQRSDQLCALHSSGTIECRGVAGQDPYRPIAGISDGIALANGPTFPTTSVCALRKSGGVACWHDGETSATPVPGISDAVELAGGEWAACVRRSSGKVACWGDRAYLGLGP